MNTDRGPTAARGRSAASEGRLRTCLPARVPPPERDAGNGGAERQETPDQRQETPDQEWNVVRGED